MHQAKENTSGDLLQCKLHHDRTIVTAPGLRCRFLSPMNHPDRLFRIVSGTPATDTYRFAMDFPFLATGPDALRGIERSSPIAQVIPFRRDAADGEADIPPETPYQQKNLVRVSRWRAVLPMVSKIGCKDRLCAAELEQLAQHGHSHDSALARTITGRFKAEVFHRRRLKPIGNIPPADAEANHHAALATEARKHLMSNRLRQTRSGP